MRGYRLPTTTGRCLNPTKSAIGGKRVVTVRKSVFPSQEPYKGFIPRTAVCYRCGRPAEHRHHVFAGSLRAVSEREGLWVYLCEDCHESPLYGIHAKKTTGKRKYTDDEHLRWHTQQMWECQVMKKFGFTRSQAREADRKITKSPMPSYEYVQEDDHGMWLLEWR